MADEKMSIRQIRSSQINEKVNATSYDVILPETRANLVKDTFGSQAAEWIAQKDYIIGDAIYVTGEDGSIASYECVKAHKSGNSFSNANGEWKLILSRRFVTPADEINWSEGGIALKYRGEYSETYNYKANDVVVYGKEYYIAKQKATGVAPILGGDSEVWKNLSLYANEARKAEFVKVQNNPAMNDSNDTVYLIFSANDNSEEASLFTNKSLAYEVNRNYLDVVARAAENYNRSFDYSKENNYADFADGSVVATSINEEFRKIYQSIKDAQGSGNTTKQPLSIKVNGEAALESWYGERAAEVNIEISSETVSDWDSKIAEEFVNRGDANYVKYSEAQELTPEQKAQARANINAAEVADYVIKGADGKIDINDLPETVVGGLQYKGTYDATVGKKDEEGKFIVPEMGDYYIVSEAGNLDPAGNIHTVENSETTYFRVGDWAIYNGEEGWAKIDNTDAVKTVNGQIGDVKTYRGLYSSETQYYAGDWVKDGDILYLAIADSKGVALTEGSAWQVAGRIYEGENGIKVEGNKISHTNVLTTETEKAETIAANGGQFSVDINEYDAQGHVVKTQKQNITLSQTWREVKVGETVVVAGNSNEALNVAGNAPITVEGSDHTVYVKHNTGTKVDAVIDLSVPAEGQVIANVVSSDEYGHVNGTRELKLANLAMKDGDQTLSGIKTYKRANEEKGAVILPEVSGSYDLGSSNKKFRDIYADNFIGNASSATQLKTPFNISVSLDNGKEVVSQASSTDGTTDVNLALEMPDMKYEVNGIEQSVEGTWCAVSVNKKGLVTWGGHVIEFGKEVDKDPSASLVTGGLFFRMVQSN